MVTQPGPRASALLIASWLVVIAVATLMPAETSVTFPASCVFCGQFGGVDFVLNIALFVPLGMGLRWRFGSRLVSGLVGAATTVVIETLQWRLIPGRDASLGDILANTLGALLGAWLATEGLRWLNATGTAARRLTISWGLLATGIVVASAVLLKPAPTRYPQWVQWVPLRSNMGVFRAQLKAVELNGAPIHPTQVLRPGLALDTATQGVGVRAAVEGVAPPTGRRAYIVRIANDEEEGFSLTQLGDALIFRTNLWSARLKLHTLALDLPHAFPSEATGSNGEPGLALEGESRPDAMTVSSTGPGHSQSITLNRTVGLAWALFVPWNFTLSPAWWPVSALWLAAVMIPVAYFAGRSAHATPDEKSRGIAWWPLAMALVTIAIVPATLGLGVLSAGEGIGVGLGTAAGLALGLVGIRPRTTSAARQ